LDAAYVQLPEDFVDAFSVDEENVVDFDDALYAAVVDYYYESSDVP
jgi:hypothetical protein